MVYKSFVNKLQVLVMLVLAHNTVDYKKCFTPRRVAAETNKRASEKKLYHDFFLLSLKSHTALLN